jgi:outer membrane biosynthesis protein TonB
MGDPVTAILGAAAAGKILDIDLLGGGGGGSSTPEPAPAPAPAPTPPPAPKPPKPPAPKPAPKPKPKPAPKPSPTEGKGAPKKPDTGAGTTTAKAGVEEAAIIKAQAEGPAEEKVAETAKKGRRSTIATTPQGLLTSEPATRRRRSLMGGLIK